MIPLLYPLKVILISGLLYGYYWLFLRNGRFHGYNRAFLLGITLLSPILPLIPLPGSGFSIMNHAAPATLSAWQLVTAGGPVTPTITHSPRLFADSSAGYQIFIAIYLLLTAVFLYRSFRSVCSLRRLALRSPSEEIDGVRVYRTREPGTPFSVLGRIYWNAELDIDSSLGQQIFLHEWYHVRQKHTIDVLFLEGVCAVCWFNPIFHLIRREIKVIHEFLADQYASSGNDRHDYAELLILQAIDNSRPAITHHFYSIHLKRRIIMITQFKKSRAGYLSRIMVIPLLVLLCSAFASVRLPAVPKASTSSSFLSGGMTGVTDSAMETIVHYYRLHLRYPLDAVTKGQETTLWIAVKFGDKGAFLGLSDYDHAPDADEKKWSTITVIAPGPGSAGNTGKGDSPAAQPRNDVFRAEAKRVSGNISSDKKAAVIPPGEYFIKLVFALRNG